MSSYSVKRFASMHVSYIQLHSQTGIDCCSLTTDGNFLAVAGGDPVDVWQTPEQLPSFQEELENIARVELLLGGIHV